MHNCRFLRMSVCLLSLLAILIPSGLVLATGSEGGFEKEADGYQVQLVFEEHPKTGPNQIGLKITDPVGNPLVGGNVEVLPLQLSSMLSDDESEAHGAAEGEHAESQEEAHHEPGEESNTGHSDPSVMDEHGEAESYSDVEVGSHEETGGHAELKSVLLKTSQEAGFYTGKISFEEPGDWVIRVRFTQQNGSVEKELDFPVDVIAAGPPWAVLSGFFGINLIIVAVAGFLKRKPSAAKL